MQRLVVKSRVGVAQAGWTVGTDGLQEQPLCWYTLPVRERATTELGVLSEQILADLERLRPGWPTASTESELSALCAARVRVRLPELHRELSGDEDPPDGSAVGQRHLYEREMLEILVPRYAKLAHKQGLNERDQRGALRNAAVYALIFFALGLFIVWAPFIPIWEKWVPFALAALSPVFSRWLPDLARTLDAKRHQLQLGLLQVDLDRAGESLPLPPLGLLDGPHSDGMPTQATQPQHVDRPREKEPHGNGV